MTVFDLYSKRQKRLRGEVSDVYVYDVLPQELRVQVVHLWNDVIGDKKEYEDDYLGVKRAYIFIVETLRREYGVFQISEISRFSRQSYLDELSNFILNENNVERCIDAIELSFRFVDTFARKFAYRRNNDASKRVDDCIEELNDRFKEHGVGFQYVDGEIIRVDSQFLHNEAVKPALGLLHGNGYQGPRDEFLSAFEHYRHKHYKEALNDALKSLESTIKVICGKKGWTYDSRDTAKKLIGLCISNGLFPSYYQNHLTALATLLESGVPTIRNKESGHGQGEQVVEIEGHVVAYTLHMTASAIVLLAESERILDDTLE